MKITLIGMGSGCPESLTVQGYAALREADLILGARRLLSALPAGCTENRAAAYLPDEILELLHASGCENAALLYSGDTGFYSGASALVERLQAQGYQPVVLPGLSSVQMLSAALGRPWQDWKLVSAHGRACDPVAECMEGKPTFFLTGGSESPATLCAQLAAEGFGKLAAAVGENLGTPEQKVYTGTVGQLAASRFESLSVLLVEAAQVDGANHFQVFWRVKWAQMMPTTLYILVITTINSFQCFALIQLLTSGGPNHSTDTIMYYIYYTAFKLYRYGYGNAMGVVLAIIIAILSAIQFKVGNQNN